MTCNNEKATRPAMFSIAWVLTAAGLVIATLCVPTTAMATGTDTIEQQPPSTIAQAPPAPESIVSETQDAGTPVLEGKPSETTEKSVDPSPMPVDSEQSLLEKQKQQFLARHILFAHDSSQLDDQAQEQIREQAAWLAGNPDVNIQIIGNCDQNGSEDYNMALGKKRAHAVKTGLENLGISPQRLTEISYGKNSPVPTTTDQTAARINRRVEFRIQPAA